MTTALLGILIALALLFALCMVGFMSLIANHLQSLVKLAAENHEEMRTARACRAAIDAKSALEATEFLDLQKRQVEANLAIAKAATARLEAESKHIATCEERYLRSIVENEALVSAAKKVKTH